MRLATCSIWKCLTAFVAVGNIATLAGAASFHNGGVGQCDGCHTMHRSQLDAPAVSSSLLAGTDPSSVCLNCHAGWGPAGAASILSSDGSALTPGGDFYWLNKNFSWIDGWSDGQSHGHNVIAQDFGLFPDTNRLEAPGGNYPSLSLGCTSCHDPHGKVNGGTESGNVPISGSGSYGELAAPGTIRGNYRLLGDSQYNGDKLSGGYPFNSDAPVARQSLLVPYGESDTSHVDYGSGMSEWCANCHISYQIDNHDVTGGSGFKHAAGNNKNLEANMIIQYNTYISTGDLSGVSATAYLQFVPFERNTTDTSLLDPNSTLGPDGNSNVMCLSCHRAHASAFRAMGRWDFDATLLIDSHPMIGDGGVSGLDPLYSYYGRDISTDFGPGQQTFCEKCHSVIPAP